MCSEPFMSSTFLVSGVEVVQTPFLSHTVDFEGWQASHTLWQICSCLFEKVWTMQGSVVWSWILWSTGKTASVTASLALWTFCYHFINACWNVFERVFSRILCLQEYTTVLFLKLKGLSSEMMEECAWRQLTLKRFWNYNVNF